MVEDFVKQIGADKVINTIGAHRVDSAHVVVYGAVILAATLYLVARQIRKTGPKASLSLRPRSPDPEKPTDVTTYAANRMKPTERPPGSKSHHCASSATDLTNSQPGSRAISSDPKLHHTQTGLPQITNLAHTVLSATGPSTTSIWASAAWIGTNGSKSTTITFASTKTSPAA